jgi:hypothetical protein
VTEDFERNRLQAVHAIAAFFIGIVLGLSGGADRLGIPVLGGWTDWLGGLVALLAVVDLVLGRSRPVVSITPRSVIFRPLALGPSREILFQQIASWAANERYLYFVLLDQSKLGLSLSYVRSTRRRDLVERLSQLGLGAPGVEPSAEHRLRRIEKQFTWSLVFWTLVLMAIGVWTALNRMP